MILYTGDPETKWYQNYSELFNFATWLNEIEQFGDENDVLEYFEKPWKWTNEHTIHELFKRGINCPDCNESDCGCFGEYTEVQDYINKLESIEEGLLSQIPNEERAGV